MCVFSKLNWFSASLPVCLLIVFWISNKFLLSIEYEKITNKLKIVTLNFIFIKQTDFFLIDNLSYSYKNEKTSRLATSYIFRVYFNEKNIFNRYHGLDGLNKTDVEKIIKEFKKLGIKEI